MSTERELHPTHDPLEPIHNPVTQTPAPATEQPTVQYLETEGKSRDEIVTALANKVLKEATSNGLRNAARAVLADGETRTVPITKYHDEPQLEAPASEPLKPEPVAEQDPETISPTDKFQAPEKAALDEQLKADSTAAAPAAAK